MKDWYAVFAVALVIVIGSAAGLSGTVAFLVAFMTAWYLLTAREIGFVRARGLLGIRLEPPVWQRSNWLWLEKVFNDSDRLLKSAAIALLVTSGALMFGAPLALGVAVLVAAYYVFEIWRGRTGPPPRAVRIRDAGADIAAHAAPAAPTTPPAVTKTTSGAAAAPAAVVAGPIARPAANPLRVLRKAAALRNQRPLARGSARKGARKRSQRKYAAQPARPRPPLPGLKRLSPIILKSRKPPRPRPPLRQRRRVRKPMTLVSRTGSAG